jgi:hypothetical protein
LKYVVLTLLATCLWRAWEVKTTKGDYQLFALWAFLVWMFFGAAWRGQACNDMAAALERASGIEIHDWDSNEQAWEVYEARDPAAANRLWEDFGKPSCAPPDPGDMDRPY